MFKIVKYFYTGIESLLMKPGKKCMRKMVRNELKDGEEDPI